MRSLLLATAMLVSTNAFAKMVDLSVSPDRPVVMTADAELNNQKVYGPWFNGQYKVENKLSETITITGIQFTTQSFEGTKTHSSFTFGSSIEIAPGSSVSFNDLYVDGLATSSSLEYNVTAGLIGWIGTANNPVDRLTVSTSFLTQ